MCSILGGTIGLFCGLSILSMFEAVFWVIRYLVSICDAALTRAVGTSDSKVRPEEEWEEEDEEEEEEEVGEVEEEKDLEGEGHVVEDIEGH